MTDETKPAFEFDPLPGDSPAEGGLGGPGGLPKPEEPAAGGQVERPKRGRPAKAGKPERKKRGPRRVSVATTDPQTAAPETVVPTTGPQKPERKKRQPKSDLPPEYAIIRQMLDMSESVRKRVMAALDKVFG